MSWATIAIILAIVIAGAVWLSDHLHHRTSNED
jgi:hypothetical protein